VFAAALAALLGALAGSATASAIDPAGSAVAGTARLGAKGTTVLLSGVVRCRGCRTFTLGATVSQPASGAIGQGGVRCICRGAAERWRLTARAREATRFRAGSARVCVWVLARGPANRAIDARQWCETVMLANPVQGAA
jgi:Family of unknown function (DUF6299)